MKFILAITLLCIFFISCNNSETKKLPFKGNFPDLSLVDSNNQEFKFSNLKGDILVVSYIYTNCPDICHIISKKLDTFKKSLNNGLSKEVSFVSITFDPSRDTPKILDQHVKSMKLDTSKWFFITGRRDKIFKTLEAVGIDPLIDKMDSKDSYTLNHRDRISLLDRDGTVRKHYKGSTFDPEELLSDLKTLL